jgi:phosphopantetheinyl transferase
MNKIDVRILSTDEIKNNLEYLLNYVDANRLARFNKYRLENDKLLTLGAGYFIKKYVGDDIFYNNYKKPYSNNIFFNISHSFNFVVFIMSNKECGIDIEKVSEASKEMSLYMFNEKIKNNEDFIYHFTLKEALLKCIGLGLNISNIKDVPSKEGLVIYQNNDYYLKSILFLDYYISVCINDNTDFDISITEEVI